MGKGWSKMPNVKISEAHLTIEMSDPNADVDYLMQRVTKILDRRLDTLRWSPEIDVLTEATHVGD